MMKYLTYVFISIASTILVMLLSLSACSPTHPTPIAQPSILKPSAAAAEAPAQQAQAPPQSHAQAAATIKIHNFKFEPASVTIAAGDTVQFINADEEPHTATSTNGTFDSKALDTNETWNYTATQPGTFPYICSIHPFMKGTLTVTPKQS